MENTQYQSKTSKRLQQQHGFALVLFMSLLPMILAALTFLYIGTTQIELKSTLEQTCRIQLMNVQKNASNHLRTLMAVNKLVNIVKATQILALLSRVVLVGLPILAPILQSILATTKTAQEAIPRIQKAIIHSLLSTMSLGILKTQQELLKVLKNYQKKTAGLWIISNQFVFPNSHPALAVEPENPQSRLTKYRITQNFEDDQRLSLSWRYTLKTSSTLLPWAPWQQSFSGVCAATLNKEEPWIATLIADKSLLKL